MAWIQEEHGDHAAAVIGVLSDRTAGTVANQVHARPEVIPLCRERFTAPWLLPCRNSGLRYVKARNEAGEV